MDINSKQNKSKYHIVWVKVVLWVRWVKHGSSQKVDLLNAGISRLSEFVHGSKSKSWLTNLKAPIGAWVNGSTPFIESVDPSVWWSHS